MSRIPEFDALLPCAVLLPSLGRPHRLEAVVANIRRTTPEDHMILACVGDPESLEILTRLGVYAFDDTGSEDKRYVTRMNRLSEVSVAFNAKTVFFGSDDVIHHHGWLSNALEVMAGPGEPSVVIVNDLHNSQGTQALVASDYLDRTVFDDPSVAFHPGYLHQFADTEMFLTAAVKGQAARAMTSIVEHLHPVWKSANALPVDETYKNAQSWKVWRHDSALWEERLHAIEKRTGHIFPEMHQPGCKQRASA